MKKLGQILAILTLVFGLVFGATACGNDSNSNDDNGYQPTASGPTINGQAYCAYIEVPEECNDSNIPRDHWKQMPASQPNGYREDNTNDLMMQLFLWHLMYNSFYGSSGYYGSHFPQSYQQSRPYAVYQSTTINNFSSKYSSQVSAAQSKSQWKDPSGKTVPGTSVKPDRIGPQRGGFGGGTTANKPGSSSGGSGGYKPPAGGYKPSAPPAGGKR